MCLIIIEWIHVKILRNINVFRVIREYDEEQKRRKKHITVSYMNRERLKLLPFWWKISFKYVKFNKHVDFLVQAMFLYADYGKNYEVDKEPFWFYFWLLFIVWSFIILWLTAAFLDPIFIYLLRYMDYDRFLIFFEKLIHMFELQCLLCPDSVTGDYNRKVLKFYYYNHIF